jgi:hypothetical protein
LEVIAGAAGQLGIEAGTYGLASLWLSCPHTQVAVIGEGAEADASYAAALRPSAFTKPCRGHLALMGIRSRPRWQRRLRSCLI